MADLEIERKFQVIQDWEIPRNSRRVRIRQAYLSTPEAALEVRVRSMDETCLMTVKSPAAAHGEGVNVRSEVEFPIPAAEFRRIWEMTTDRIEKDRWSVRLDDSSDALEAVVDVYAGAHAGLRVVEVEFNDVEQARNFRPPSWFGPEVTGRKEWGNRHLSRSNARR
ncbi:CYTH domain-containing protein [Streptomyces sp. NPDC058955]|uniref:CYTH domain-containing protein n=1 Tax=unclassified Streptomyces TaxID=2593676 RepID=UPI0036520498